MIHITSAGTIASLDSQTAALFVCGYCHCHTKSTTICLPVRQALYEYMKVRYVRKGEYQGLRMTIGKTYEVIGIEADSYRIIDDEFDPCLYKPSQFEILDSSEPDFWVSEIGEDKERYAYPFSWNKVSFFEDYHDGVQVVINQFWNDCGRLYGITKNV